MATEKAQPSDQGAGEFKMDDFQAGSAGTNAESQFADAIGSYEAKTHLPRILKEVEAGREFVITRNGQAVAKLIPIERPRMTLEDIERLKALRKKINFKLPDGVTYKDLIEEGRRY